ncbi:MAG: PAS domain S-box protein [Thermodesulfobacteriota bacterium]
MMTSVQIIFGQRLRLLRQARQLTQAALAESLDISVDYLSKIERGLASPSFAVIEHLSGFFGVEPAAFFHAEEPAAEAPDVYAQIFTDCVDPIVIEDLDGMVTDMNRQAEQDLGYARGDLVGRPVKTVIPPELHELADENLRRCLAGEEVRDRETHRLDAAGAWRPVLASLSLIRDAQGRPWRVASITKDTSALKGYQEEILASLEERECLLRELHHRVLNNLQVVVSMLELSFAREKAPECRGKIRDMMAKLHAIGQVHAQIYNAGRLSRVDLAQFVTDHMNRLRGIYRTPDITPSFTLGRVQLPVTQALPFALVFNELATNALKHAYPAQRRGPVEVGLEQEEDRIRLAVSDNGRGLPSGVDPYTSDSLGFTLIRTLVASQLDGQVRFRDNGGITVQVEFPRQALRSCARSS